MNEEHVNNNKINQNAFFFQKESILFYVYIAVF